MKAPEHSLSRCRGLRRVLAERRGATAVEMALALSAVCLFVIGIMQLGQVLWAQSALSYSVAEAARCASIDTSTCGTAAQIQSFAAAQSSYNFDSSNFAATTPSCGNQVAASYPMSFSIFYIPLSVTLTAQACYPA